MAKPSGTPRTKKRRITFLLESAEASTVHLVGDFNGWDPGKHPMKKDAQGRWVKQLLLGPGDFEYKFVADGRWVIDPNNQRRCANCFGTENSVITIAG